MEIVRKQLWSSIVIGFSAIANPVYGQIVPDGTTIDTSILGNCQSSCEITGGTVAEHNLFHSFQEFKIPPAASVYFSDPGVTNIFSRVTGNNLTEIFGTLGVSGDANLFLLNPNGIVFGEGAALDLNGSFFATTADEIQFGDRSFSATPNSSENNSLLTVDPSALFFTQSEGSIILKGAELATVPGQNIALVGQGGVDPGIEIDNSNINVYDGSIILGAVEGRASVSLGEDWQLEFDRDTVKGDISLTAASNVTANNSDLIIRETRIDIDAGNLIVKENSGISSFTNSSQSGATIAIDASESVQITGESPNIFQRFLIGNLTPGGNFDLVGSRLQTISEGMAQAGDIKIDAKNLAIENGAGIISTSENRGASGNIAVDVAETFQIKNSGLLTGSNTLSQGGVGKLDIDTNQLLVEKGGIISSVSLGNGNAGNVTLDAESIQISETPTNSIIPTGIFTNTIFGNGNGGNLSINTQKLILQDGGQISASSGAITRNGLIPVGGKGGNISIDAAEYVEVGGISQDGVFFSSILSDTRADDPAGNITISTGNLFLNPYGSVSASSLGTGTGGNITINARDSVELVGIGNDSLQQVYTDVLSSQVRLENVPVGLTAFTILAGDTGNISITTPRLSLKSGALLGTGTLGAGNAGNIDINTSQSVEVIGSLIVAPTFGTGDAGNIVLHTENLSIADGGGIVSISSSSGDAGNVSIFATESIELSNAVADVLFPATISTASYAGLGFPGNLTLATKLLSIKDGAVIQTNNTVIDSILGRRSILEKNPFGGRSAQLTINASESIEISGSSLQNNPFSPTPNSQISSTTNTSTRASDININTGKLSLFNGGEISVNSLGKGAAGSINVVADSISMGSNASFNGSTNSGLGGNIILQIDSILRLNDNSAIDTNALALGDGGNIDITSDFVVAAKNSSISANAATGYGGNVNITAKELFVSPNSQITADSTLGIDGTVKINTTVNTDNNYTELPQQIIPTENTIVQSCGSSNDSKDVFFYTGRGGLPPNPLTEFQISDPLIADLAIPNETTAEELVNFSTSKIQLENSQATVVEASHWQINSQGKVELIAADSRTKAIAQPPCPFVT